MAHAFFLSYSALDAQNGAGAVEWFYTTLLERLTIVHGGQNLGEGGFKADLEVQPGEDWRRGSFPDALNRSHVLVCLQSPNYFNSEYCGKELEFFLRRRRRFVLAKGGEAPVCVVPVVWQPARRAVPRSVPDFQWKRTNGAQFPAEVEGLFETYDNHRSLGNAFIQQLAKRISSLLMVNEGDNELPSLPGVPDIDAVPSAFQPPRLPLPRLDRTLAAGPRSVTFVYPARQPDDDWPFGPPDDNMAVIRAAAIARSRELAIQGIEFGPDAGNLADSVGQAQKLNTPVILMLTSKSLGNPRLVEQFSTIDANGLATVVVDRAGSRVQPHLLATLRNVDRFHDGLKTAEELDEAIRRSLAVLRQSLGHRGEDPIGGGSGHPTLPTF